MVTTWPRRVRERTLLHRRSQPDFKTVETTEHRTTSGSISNNQTSKETSTKQDVVRNNERSMAEAK